MDCKHLKMEKKKFQVCLFLGIVSMGRLQTLHFLIWKARAFVSIQIHLSVRRDNDRVTTCQPSHCTNARRPWELSWFLQLSFESPPSCVRLQMFSHSAACLFTLLEHISQSTVLILVKSSLPWFLFVACSFEIKFKNLCLILDAEDARLFFFKFCGLTF
jgi:hypothetical protein